MNLKLNWLLVVGAIALSVLVGWTGYGQKRNGSRVTWEYKAVNLTSNNFNVADYEAQLNQLGSQGWELVSEKQDGGSNFIRYTLKRAK